MGGSVAATVDGIYVSAPCLTNDLQPVTGEVIWTVSTGCGGGGGNTPAVNGGTIFSPIGDCVFCGVAYVAETGASLAAYDATATPAISPTTSYILDGTSLVSAPLSGGHSNWTFTGDGQLVTAPIVVNDYVFVGSSAGNLYALDATTGARLWSTKLGAAIPGPGPGYGQTASGVTAGDGLLIVLAGNTVNAFVLSTNP
jgi:outer membrane protein assembly factor BamB